MKTIYKKGLVFVMSIVMILPLIYIPTYAQTDGAYVQSLGTNVALGSNVTVNMEGIAGTD